MKQEFKQNRGITLIVLIITIIILLILVGVSVNLLIKGDLFGSAEKAVNGTNAKVEEEQTRVDDLMGKLEDVNAKNSKHNWQYTDSTRAKIRCTCARCKAFNDGDSTGRTLSIGQQIGETESKTASTSITSAKSGYKSGQTLTLNAEETKWVVFGYEDKDKDGLNEVLLLTTEHPTTNIVYFKGASAYNNAVEEVNRMCKELYGTNARGITIEDVNRALGYTPAGGMYDLNDTCNTTGNLTTKLKDLGDMWTAIKNNNDTNYSGKYYDPSNPEGISDNGAVLGEYELNGYFYAIDSTVGAPTGVPQVSSEISATAKAMIFGSSKTNYGYWLASRGVRAGSDYAGFGPGTVDRGGAFSCYYLFFSNGRVDGTSRSFSLRPLVSLTSEIPAEGEILDFSGKFGVKELQ